MLGSKLAGARVMSLRISSSRSPTASWWAILTNLAKLQKVILNFLPFQWVNSSNMRTTRLEIFCILALMLAASVLFAGNPAVDALKSELQVRYGYRPRSWHGWADAEDDRPIVNVFETACKETGIDPAYAYTIAVGEGLIEWLNESKEGGVYNLNQTVDGWKHLGLDYFCWDIARLRANNLIKGTLIEGTHYVCRDWRNEQGSAIRYPEFTNLTNAVNAFVATLRLYDGLLEQHRKELGIPELSEDRKAYWRYAYFIDGERDAKADLAATRGDFSLTRRTLIKEKSLVRVGTWRLVQRFSLFNGNNPNASPSVPAI